MHQINWLKSIVQSDAKTDEPFDCNFLAIWYSDFSILDAADALGVLCMGGEL